ncbi:MAG: DUF1844 domain-containing protein [Balneolia bacterium]|nr:DUF1844 domain-containing protein [Balneolia bacterium]
MDINSKSLPKEKKNMLLFMMLVQQYEKIARMNLGEVPNPVHNQIEEDLKSARFAIDTLDMLRDYTNNNLNAETKEYIDTLYGELSAILKKKTAAEEARLKEEEDAKKKQDSDSEEQ